MIVNKLLALPQLEAEMIAAGVTIRALGTRVINGQTDLHTYDADGAIIDVPAGAAAVVAAHTAPSPPAEPNFGADLPADMPAQIADGVTQLRAYLALSTPTAAQSTAALKLVIRALFLLLRFAWGRWF